MQKPETPIMQEDEDTELFAYPELDDERDDEEDLKTMWMLSGVVALSGIATLML